MVLVGKSWAAPTNVVAGGEEDEGEEREGKAMDDDDVRHVTRKCFNNQIKLKVTNTISDKSNDHDDRAGGTRLALSHSVSCHKHC